ncbi:MAG TPA: hypothetical protein VGX25_01040 [Actinophytocola sp.]|uniref:hypothetical protein n=1 Tax=Actinophytocola sp. TaxID=1872138 RepID=UPI002DDD6D09|nr:hypothetical protein [Actinophytocola sp.]HEV2777962.1 hypothetical protein [Actinophytocola sp.]
MTIAITCASPPLRIFYAVVASQPTVRIPGGLWPGAVTVPLRFCWQALARGPARPAALAIPLIVGATLSRLVHAYGMVTAPSLAAEGKLRFAGAVGTYLFGVGLAAAVTI